MGAKVIVFSDHAVWSYLLEKKDAKPSRIRWILLLQEFDLEIKDKSGAENLVAEDLPLKESFPDEQLLAIDSSVPGILILSIFW